MTRCLNLGCGYRYHHDWVNIDFTSTGPDVIACDLLAGIPFSSESFDVVYHSHVLEHLPVSRVPQFLAECHRVLKPGGIVRIVVPDLEQIVRLYLTNLERALAGDRTAALRRQWMVLELCDQMTRTASGGELARRMAKLEPELSEFSASRLGVEMRWWQSPATSVLSQDRHSTPPHRSFRSLVSVLCSPTRWRDIILRGLLTPGDRTALQIGRFRQLGEIHQWMYDRVAIKELLTAAGFVGIEQRTHVQSYVMDWRHWHLDSDEEGKVAKPDSLFMEARRPEEASTPSLSPNHG